MIFVVDSGNSASFLLGRDTVEQAAEFILEQYPPRARRVGERIVVRLREKCSRDSRRPGVSKLKTLLTLTVEPDGSLGRTTSNHPEVRARLKRMAQS
jgi:hypothetical protein